jgi:hypothetical protein
MSVFTNPASGAPEEAGAYVKALLSLLGKQDPVQVLESTPSRLGELLDHPLPRLKRPEAPGKWSALEVAHHLADSDLVWAYRMRMVMAEDLPHIVGYDQDQWAIRLRYREADPADVFEQFALLRKINLALIRRATPDDLERVAFHEERGEESLRAMIRLYAAHDLVHLNQLQRILSK